MLKRNQKKEPETVLDQKVKTLTQLTNGLAEISEMMKNGSVLLVDDDRIICEDYAQALRRKGYYTEVTTRAEDALKRLRIRAFDVMVTDLRLPGIKGEELIEKAHIIRPEMKFIIVTAYPKDYYVDKKLNRKGDIEVRAVLMKPIDVEGQLVKRVEEAKGRGENAGN